ncbi:MAG: aspartate kinase [bacterium]
MAAAKVKKATIKKSAVSGSVKKATAGSVKKSKPIIVSKFGGTPMASANNVEKVIEMILADKRRRIIVVSAPGARGKGDKKITDLLIGAAKANMPDNRKVTDLLIGAAKSVQGTDDQKKHVREIISRFAEIAARTGAGLDILEKAVADLDERLARKDRNQARRMDSIKAYGEEWSARILAEALSSRGYEARYVDPKEAGMVVTSEYGNSQPEKICYKNLARLAKLDEIIIFPGFYGYTKEGEIATFSRGGSDLTGSLIAAAVKAKVYENFSDVHGIFVANPKTVKSPKPKVIKKLTFRELRELSYSGFSVFHDEAVQPIFQHAPDVPIHVRHYAYPKVDGTWIVRHRKAVKHEVSGIASDSGFASINVEKHLMNREVGFGRKLLEIFEKRGISYEHSPSSIDSISVVFKTKNGATPEVIESIVAEIKKTLKPDSIRTQSDLAMICIVGEGMRDSIGIAGRAASAFASANVNIEMITQGASEISIVFGVEHKDVDRAVKSLYMKLVHNKK